MVTCPQPPMLRQQKQQNLYRRLHLVVVEGEHEVAARAEPEDQEGKEHKDAVASTVKVQLIEIIVHFTALTFNDDLKIV